MTNILGHISLTDYTHLCRLCGLKVTVLDGSQIFDESDSIGHLYKKIAECLPIQIHNEDKLPKMVCEECVFKLDQFCDFRDRSLKTEYALNEMLKNVFLCNEDISVPMESLICDPTDEEALKAAASIESVQVPGVDASLDSIVLPLSESCEPVKSEGVQVMANFDSGPQDYDSSPDSDTLGAPAEDALLLPSTNLLPMNSSSEKRISAKDLLVGGDWLDCCEGCGKTGVSSGQCSDCMQENTEDGNSAGKTCPDCGKVYRSNYKLAQHMWRHTGEKPFKCSTCDKTFRSKIGLSQHEAKHTGQYEFSCNTCGKGFQCKSYLMVHQRVHSDDRPYPCETCGASFKSKQSLLDHRNRHLGLKPYLCEVCGRGFITKGLCKSHQKVHSGTDNRQYPCHVCNKLFVSKSYLATHVRIHTGEKPYMCEVCGKGFLTRVDLRIHSTVHTGEKSFVCEMCGKAFARRDALRCHRRSHTGERPYRCDICGQSFTQFSPMAIHKRLHTGERPYSCDLCAKTFVSKSTMMSHRKKHLSQVPATS